MKILQLLAALLVATWLNSGVCSGQVPSTKPVEGLRENRPNWYLIENATLHPEPGTTMERGSILVHGEQVIAVGNGLKPPVGTMVIDAQGRHVYAGLMDGYIRASDLTGVRPAADYWNEQIHSTLSAGREDAIGKIPTTKLREAGFTAGMIAPGNGLVKGRSAAFLFDESRGAQALIRDDVTMGLSLTTRFRFGERGSGGPTSPMGAYALIRQVMLDAQWYQDAWRIAANDVSVSRPEVNDALAAMQPVLDGRLPVLIDTSNEIFSLRAHRFAQEFGLKLMLLGSGLEYRRLDEIAALHVPILLPVEFPDAPELASASQILDASLQELMHWDHAPENPARLQAAGVEFAFTTDGHENFDDFWKHIRLAVKRGLPEEGALRAMTVTPARLMAVDDKLGTIEPGKFASFTITDAPLFDEKCKFKEVWVAGKRFELGEELEPHQDGIWQVAGNGLKFFMKVDTETALKVVVARNSEALNEKKTSEKGADAKDDSKRNDVGNTSNEKNDVDESSKKKEESAVACDPASLKNGKLNGAFDAKILKAEGVVIFSLQFTEGESADGLVVMPDGRQIVITASRPGKKKMATNAKQKKASAEPGDEGEKIATQEQQADTKQQVATPKMASHPVNYPFGDFGQTELPQPVKSCLIRNVTVWTCGPDGILEGASVLFESGVIRGVYRKDESLPKAEMVIDGRGRHLTPGLIDCHSHMATDSGVNEVGQAITAEVRIGDFIDCDDMTIYRQLAGGLTTSNILHGSANPIGGQNQVIKLRWGRNDEDMKFAEAPAGIKFALGENVKQSNSREPSNRYPQTRMGVEQIIADEFVAAREYVEQHKQWQEKHEGLPPRRDLELEAIAEILEGTRWIHCHSYRQDEIVALIRVLDRFGVTIGSFQHILEGYKVADEIARHGGTASAFSDWWAYKVEVIDAIPHAGAIMHDAGIVVSFNSDDGELARHMNHEAVKAVKYGGLSEEEALKFVTLNPAIQLRIDDYVGSIEVGKHADLVLWSGSPLDLTSRCEQTWIDGCKYFDRAEHQKLAALQGGQRAELVQKALQSDSKGKGGRRSGGRSDDSLLWPRFDEYCHGHDHEHGEE